MYVTLLYTHSFTRWLVLIAALVTLVTAYRGWFGKRSWDRGERLASRIFTGILEFQVLLGLILYFVSPLVRSAFGNFGAAMRNEPQRFFALEHISMMLLAFVLARVGTVQVQRATTDAAKFRQAAIWYSLAVLAIVVAIPWWRPLLRGL